LISLPIWPPPPTPPSLLEELRFNEATELRLAGICVGGLGVVAVLKRLNCIVFMIFKKRQRDDEVLLTTKLSR
jgi:hypothetical protein